MKLFRADSAVTYFFTLFGKTYVVFCFFQLTAYCLSASVDSLLISPSVLKATVISAVSDDKISSVSYHVVNLLPAWGSERTMKKLGTHYPLGCHQQITAK